MKKQIFYMTFIALLSGCNCYKGNILQIEEQGSFAVGGACFCTWCRPVFQNMGDHS